METNNPKPVVWIGRSKKHYNSFPPEVLDDFGHALRLVQKGERIILGAKPLSGGVLKGLRITEIVKDFDGDTYRLVYTTKLEGVVYVLHAFKKKSTHGIATPQHEIELIRMRYATAVQLHEQEFEGREKK
ncbi:MAG TPA: type II toxin-antitoxin system RelE/ParE family toxin [Longimicrobiaceae bacterium]